MFYDPFNMVQHCCFTRLDNLYAFRLKTPHSQQGVAGSSPAGPTEKGRNFNDFPPLTFT